MSFYRFPFPNMIRSWTVKGKALRWAIKVNRLITHTFKFGQKIESFYFVFLKFNSILLDPESVKEVLAKERSWSTNRRRNVINAYTKFIKFNKIEWEKPKCRLKRKSLSYPWSRK